MKPNRKRNQSTAQQILKNRFPMLADVDELNQTQKINDDLAVNKTPAKSKNMDKSSDKNNTESPFDRNFEDHSETSNEEYKIKTKKMKSQKRGINKIINYLSYTTFKC